MKKNLFLILMLLMLQTLPVMSQEQTSMPQIMFNWSDDGTFVVIEINCPNNESADIYYRYEDLSWNDDGWYKYEWPLFYADPGGHMIEAYAVVDGLAPSEIVQEYFYILKPIYLENGLFYKIVSDNEVWVCSDENYMMPHQI